MKTILFSILALGVLGALFGALLAYASRIFFVDTDPREEKVRQCLAGANCGGCGFPGCSNYAAAIVAGKAPVNKRVPGGEGTAEKISAIMGLQTVKTEIKFAFVRCSGGTGIAEPRFNYSGPLDCRSAMLFGGKDNKLCTFACIGFGNCTRVCKFGAIHIENGVAVVDRTKCAGCGACVEECPKKIITLIPKEQRVMPACSSQDKGTQVNKMCKAGCIGCMKCQRECPAGAIKVVDNLASVDASLCTGCGHCAEVCPRKIITFLS